MKNLIKSLILVVVFAVCTVAHAEAYLDVGLGVAKSDYSYQVSQKCYDWHYGCSSYTAKPVDGYMGTVEAGYTSGSYTIYYSHTSIINERDGRGLNMLGVKKRIKLFE